MFHKFRWFLNRLQIVSKTIHHFPYIVLKSKTISFLRLSALSFWKYALVIVDSYLVLTFFIMVIISACVFRLIVRFDSFLIFLLRFRFDVTFIFYWVTFIGMFPITFFEFIYIWVLLTLIITFLNLWKELKFFITFNFRFSFLFSMMLKIFIFIIFWYSRW